MNEWEESAACRNLDPSLFWMPDIEGRFTNAALKSIGDKLAVGREHCDACPVSSPCGAGASSDDKKYTTRGGELPTAYRTSMSGLLGLTKRHKTC